MIIQEPVFFSFLNKTKPIKQKNINISYLIMILIKIRLLIFLLLIRYELLACKCRIISQMSLYNWIAFSNISGIAYSYF